VEGAGGVGAGGGVGVGAGVVVGAGVGASHHVPPHCPQFVGLDPHQPPEHSPLPVLQPPVSEASVPCRFTLRRAASDDKASAVSDTTRAENRISAGDVEAKFSVH